MVVWLALLLCGATAFGADCKAAETMEEFLSPNTVIFSGNIRQDAAGKPVYQVSELLWGKLPAVEKYDGTDMRLYAVRLDSGCEPDWIPINHEWVIDVRRAIQTKLPAVLAIRVRSSSADIADADVVLSGNGKEFRGRTGTDGRFRIETPMPPGAYRLKAAKQGYREASVELSVLPGGGGEVQVVLKGS